MAFDARAALRLLAVLLVSVTALGSALAAVVVVRAPHASVGFALAGLTVRAVAPHSGAAAAGLHRGDVLAADTSAGTRLRALWYDAYAPGQTEQITFTHDGTTKTVLLRAHEHATPFNPATRAVLDLRLLSYVLFILTGAALVLLHPARFTWAFFACCVGLANFPAYVAWSLTTVSPALGIVAFALWTALADVASVAFLAFALRFPADRLAGWRRIAWRTLPLWLAAFLAFDFWSLRATYDGTPIPDAFVRAADAAGLAVWALGAASLAGTYRSAGRGERRRLQWAIAGAIAGALAWYVERVLAHGGYPLLGHIVGIATLAMPLSLAYATLKHRVVDVRFVLNRALTYSILGSGVAALFALSTWFLATTLQREGVQLALQVLLALVVGAWLYRTHRNVEAWLEAVVFRRLRRAQDALRGAAAAAPAAPSLDALEAAVANAAVAALGLESAALYRCGPGGAFVRTAASGSANALPTALPSLQHGAGAFAVAGDDGETALALLVCGPHVSGYALDAGEAALIAHFVSGIAPLYRRLARRRASVVALSALVRDPATFGDAAFCAALGAHIAAQLGPEDRGVLEWCALLPRATLDDVAALAGASGAARLLDLASSTAFVERTPGGVFVVCPLLRPVFARGAGASAFRALAVRADACAQGGDPLRAAEIAAAAGDRDAALGWLECAPAQETLPPALDALLTSGAPLDVAGRPRLALARARRLWLLEADPAARAAASAALEHAADAATRHTLAAWIAYSLAESGEFASAERALVTAGAYGTAVAALVAAKRGRLDDCERLARDADRDGVVLASQIVRAVALERAAGRWIAARALLAAALASARTAQEALLVLGERAFVEWLCGDDEQARTLAAEMLCRSAESGVHALDCVARAILGERPACSESLLPRFAAYARLVASARAADDECAGLHAALASATVAGEPFLRVLAHVALAARQADGEPLHLAEAAALADAAGTPALTAALGAFSAGHDAGMLGAFVRRFRAGGVSAPLVVEIATAGVRRGDEFIAVPERELALLLLLAASRRAQPPSALVDALWPELDEAGGIRALQTCAYRVRRRLGAPEAVVYVAQGYRLGAHVGVDLDDAERELRAPGEAPSPLARLRFEEMAAHLAAPRPAITHAWEWYDPLERRVAAAAREVRRRLAADALERGNHESALRYAQDMLAADDFDEGARDIALRVHAERDDAPEGLREVRLFDALLARDAEPRERPVHTEREAKTSTNGSAARA